MPYFHKICQSAQCTRILKLCNLYTYPTMAPTPTSVSWATPIREVKSSGAELPAAMNVAPATSSESFSFSEITSRAGTKKSSHTTARPVECRKPNMKEIWMTDDWHIHWHSELNASVWTCQEHVSMGHVNNIPSMHFFTGISSNAPSKSHMLPLTECVWDFQTDALRDTH